MKVFESVKELRAELDKAEQSGIGFVPTMGALHAGHRSLVERARRENGTVVVSVFVNPTQFNDKNDLKHYPRTPEADARLLEEAGADFVLMPSVEEIYPQPDSRQFDFGLIDKVMEGATRPGHFNGVAQVVSRLFDIVRPARAYFGEKDFQQIAVIKSMVAQLALPIEIVECAIIRRRAGPLVAQHAARRSAPGRSAAHLRHAARRSVQIAGDDTCPAQGVGHGRGGAQPVAEGHLLPVGRRTDDAGGRHLGRLPPHPGLHRRTGGRYSFNRQHLYPIMKFQIEVIKSKIHRVTVTQADLNYVGSITIDEALLEAANIIEGEKVQIMDINNGERFETYVIKGERASGCICLNGAAARKVQVGDVIIIASYALMDFEDAKQFKPWVIFPDTATNHLIG